MKNPFLLNRDRGTLREPLYPAESSVRGKAVLFDEPQRLGAELTVRINIRETTFPQMKGRTLEVVQVVDNLCEFCRQPVSSDEARGKAIMISTFNDHHSLVARAAAHDRVEVDLEENRIYIYDHAYPCVFHPECLKKP